MFTLTQLKHLQHVLEAAQDSYMEQDVYLDDDFNDIIGQDGIPAFVDPNDAHEFEQNAHCLIKVTEEIEKLKEELDFKLHDFGMRGMSSLQQPSIPAMEHSIMFSNDFSKEDIEKFREAFHNFITTPVKCDCGGHKVKVPCREWCSTQRK